MTVKPARTLGLIVQGSPYENRVARANIDLALAAAAMDFEIHVYFSGAAILQLASQRESGGAMLPPGYKAWAALPELAETVVYGERSWLDYCRDMQVALVLPVRHLDATEMRTRWRLHDHVMAA